MFLVDILVFLLVLGLLVFFHELGHFLAAKACHVYVDRFSLGMPPRVFGVRLGETDYALGALPFGGYVKMAGQEDTPLSDEEREQTYGNVPEERWFNKRPAWQRFIIVLAGPSMNLVLAILLYAIIASVGATVPESEVDTRVGEITPGSPAALAPLYQISSASETPDLSRAPDATGWRTGDRILSIDGRRVTSITDVAVDAALGAGDKLLVRLERTPPGGSPVEYVSPVEPVPMEESTHTRFGIAPFEAALVDQALPGTPAERAGLQPGDVITLANGQMVDRSTFVSLVEETPEGSSLTLTVERDGQPLSVTLTPETRGRIREAEFTSYPARGLKDPESAPPMVVAVRKPPSPEELRPGDLVEEVEGQPATFARLKELEQARPGGRISMTVRRPARLFGLAAKETRLAVTLPVDGVRAIGVRLGTKMVFSRVPALQVIPEAFRLGYQDVGRTVRTLVMLVTGAVSPRELGGPVMIYQVTTSAARAGYWWLFKITAFISVNLCVFNLLPLPVLDGGLLVCLVIEGFRGKPFDRRVLERVQQVGLIVIILLLLFVTFNDFARLVAAP